MRFIIMFIFLAGKCFGQNSPSTFQCLPCGQSCDLEVYREAGNCPHCQMSLVKTSTITFKTVAAADMCRYIKAHPKVVLLDVRSPEEFAGGTEPNYGTLKNAINAPIQELEKSFSSIAHLKDKEIIVFCSHSHRSPRVSYLLATNGFKHVSNMSGGMSVMPDGSCVKR